MRENLNVRLFERFIKENFNEVLVSAPNNSMTPCIVRTEQEDELIFLVKAESWLYKPLHGKTVDDKVDIKIKTYMESTNLIFGFDVQPDINLESEIPDNRIKGFLKILKQQDILTLVIMDYLTLNIAWLSNTIPFWSVKDTFNPLFAKYNV